MLDPEAKIGLLPPQPSQEITVTLAGVSAEGALLTHQLTDPNTGGSARLDESAPEVRFERAVRS